MIETDNIAPHMAAFLAMLDTAFRRYGVAAGLPDHLRAAVQAVPRDRFVHRFRIGDGVLQDADADPAGQRATIYSDQVMTHVDAAGSPLPSSNSQPSYVLWLLHLLDLRPGQSVLEIGSGSGWLAAVMARLVGPQGRVTGIEILPDLAAQSRADLAALGQTNVTIVTGDGTAGHAASAPFDRVIITAATWDLPVALFTQVAAQGLVRVPIELRGEVGCQVTLLRRAGARFVAEHTTSGWWVPLVGAGQDRPGPTSLDSLNFWPTIGTAPALRCPLPFGGSLQFRAFLGRTEPGFTVFGADVASAETPWLAGVRCGLVDAARHSVAVCAAGELLCYGDLSAGRRLARAYAQWAELGMPGLLAFDLAVVPREQAPVAAGGTPVWVEPRGDTALIWHLKPDATAWRALLERRRAGFDSAAISV